MMAAGFVHFQLLGRPCYLAGRTSNSWPVIASLPKENNVAMEMIRWQETERQPNGQFMFIGCNSRLTERHAFRMKLLEIKAGDYSVHRPTFLFDTTVSLKFF